MGRAGYHQPSNNPRMSIWHPGPWWGPTGPGSAPTHTWPIDAPGSASAPAVDPAVLQATTPATALATTTPQPAADAQLASTALLTQQATPPESPHQAAIAPSAPAPRQRTRTRAAKPTT